MASLSADGFESSVHTFVGGFRPRETTADSRGVLLDVHERRAGEIRQVMRDCAIRFAGINAFQRSADTLLIPDRDNRVGYPKTLVSVPARTVQWSMPTSITTAPNTL